MSTVAALLTVVGLFIIAFGAWAGFWVWLDAKEAAEQRRHEAEMADALQRSRRVAQTGRYLTDDADRPE